MERQEEKAGTEFDLYFSGKWSKYGSDNGAIVRFQWLGVRCYKQLSADSKGSRSSLYTTNTSFPW